MMSRWSRVRTTTPILPERLQTMLWVLHGCHVHMLTICSHANAHCIMKILKGSLVETRYAWPTVDLNTNKDQPLNVISEKTYEADQVAYMSDKLGLHRISNPDPHDYAVSLHCQYSAAFVGNWLLM